MKNLLTLLLLGASVFLSFRHGYSSFRTPSSPEQQEMTELLDIPPAALPYVGVLSLVIGVLLLLPRTFFVANLLNAVTILVIMALALHADVPRIALLEIPFLALPLLLIWLKYPFIG